MEHIAIDLGSRESQICIRDASGKIVRERKLRTAALPAFLAKRPPSHVIVESSAEALLSPTALARLGTSSESSPPRWCVRSVSASGVF